MDKNQETTSSTTPSFQIPKWYLRYVSFLEFISFKLAATEIRKRFFTPIPFSLPKRERPFIDEAEKKTLEVKGRQITLRIVGEGTKVAVFIHGWSGRGSQVYAMAPELVNAGYKVVTITAQAHGNNPGKRTHMLQFTDAILATAEYVGKVDVLLAHSLGGAAAFNALNQGLQVEKLIILGAPSSIIDVVKDFCEKLKLSEKYEHYLIQYLRDNYQEDIEALAPRELAKRMSVPGMIVHDKDDIDVGYAQAERLHANWKGSELILTERLGHRRILSDTDVVNAIIRFVNS